MTAENQPHSSVEGTTPVLYYDGQCPLCAGEISALAKRRGTELSLVDVHSLPEDGLRGTDESFSKEELLKTLHLRTSDGEWLTGADANVGMWTGTRRGKALTVLRWPLLRLLVDKVYAIWAEVRYRRLYPQGGTKAAAPATVREVEHQG
ncbi:MAG: DUF393 domain-containing protein [Pseudomonadota bacterium]